MQLTEEQAASVGQWVGAGASLSDVQRRIKEEFGISLTYMDVRFLVIELGAKLQDKAPRRSVDLASMPAAPGANGRDDALPASGVTVEVDRITKPGTLVSGSVVFSDGVRAEWGLDQMGRIALGGTPPAYSPVPEDVTAFQMELRRLLETRGF